MSLHTERNILGIALVGQVFFMKLTKEKTEAGRSQRELTELRRELEKEGCHDEERDPR